LEARSAASTGLLRLLAPLFLLSGLTALVYEVVWFKRFEHAFGVAPVAMGAVVASFLIGLGIGARWIGAAADRWRRPLVAYGWCELGIGLLALLIPFEIELAHGLAARAYPLIVARPIVGALLQCALALVVLGPPCVLMGGTLPLLVKAMTRPGEGIGSSTGMLYALNTVGAALGAYLAGFHLLPALGVQGATYVAVAGNLVIAAAAIGIGRSRNPVARVAPEPKAAAAELPPRAWIPLAVAFLLGFAALLLQIVWMRQMALIVGGSTYAFSAVLAILLVGIGLGSFASRRGLSGEIGAVRRRRTLQAAIAFLALSVVATQRAVPAVVDFVSAAVELRPAPLYNALICIAAAVALVLVPSMVFGYLFPWVVAARFRDDGGEVGTEGATVGAVAWWNTLGCLCGATAAPLLLIPTIGSQATVAVALGLAWLALLGAEGVGPRVRPAWVLVAAVLGVGVVAYGRRGADPYLLNLGTYSSGYLAGESQEQVLVFEEGRACNVLVTEGANRALRLNGKVDASDTGDMPTQLGCGYFGRFLRPDAKDVLVLGFGSGTTSGALLLDPDTRVTCCEIEEEVLAASWCFAHVNHEPTKNPRFEGRVVDGRMHLAGSPDTYDLIVSVPSNPWVAGIGNLFTESFYEAARGRLRDDGMLVQWLQTYELAAEDYALVLRTISSVFPNVGVLRVDELDTVVVASMGELLPPREDFVRAQAFVDATPLVARDLERWFGTRDVGRLMLRHFVAGPEGVKRMLHRFPDDSLNTLDEMRLEFDSARGLFGYTPEGNALVLSSIDGRWQRELTARVPDREAAAVEWRGLHEAMLAAGVEDAEAMLAAGYAVAPDDPYLAMRRTLRQPPREPDAFDERVREIAAGSRESANLLGGHLWEQGDFARSARVFELLLERWPDSATQWANLAISQRDLGATDDAAESLRKALELDPWNEFVRSQLDALGGP